MLVGKLNSREQELRAEFKRERDCGLVANYAQWLEARLIAQEKEHSQMVMAAGQNFDLWRKASDELETLQVGTEYVRDWCQENGYTLVVRVLDEHTGGA